MKIRIPLIFAILALFISGCGTINPDGPYHGNQALYNVDLTITTSYNVLHSFVSWEYENRAALSAHPEVKKAADNVRAHAKEWLGSAIALREAYAANPTPGNLVTLQQSVDVIQAALLEATKYMAQSTISTPATK